MLKFIEGIFKSDSNISPIVGATYRLCNDNPFNEVLVHVFEVREGWVKYSFGYYTSSLPIKEFNALYSIHSSEQDKVKYRDISTNKNKVSNESKICDELQKLWALGIETQDYVLVHNIPDIWDLFTGKIDTGFGKRKSKIDIYESDFGILKVERNRLLPLGTFTIIPKDAKISHKCPTCGQEVVK